MSRKRITMILLITAALGSGCSRKPSLYLQPGQKAGEPAVAPAVEPARAPATASGEGGGPERKG